MEEEKIQLTHPQGKHMPRIDKSKYDLIKSSIEDLLKENLLSHTELFSKLESRLKGKFQGNISWYSEGVKLDLEAKRIIERTGPKPQKYKLV